MQKKQKPQQSIRYAVTPAAVVHYDHIREPDTEGEFASGKYMVEVSWAPHDDFDDLTAACDELAQEAFGVTGIYPYRDGNQTTRAEYAGAIIMKAKSQFAPRVYDTSGELYEGPVGKDAIVRVECELVAHRFGGKPGIAARIAAVELIEAGKPRAGLGRASAFARAARGLPAGGREAEAPAALVDASARGPAAVLESLRLKPKARA